MNKHKIHTEYESITEFFVVLEHEKSYYIYYILYYSVGLDEMKIKTSLKQTLSGQ